MVWFSSANVSKFVEEPVRLISRLADQIIPMCTIQPFNNQKLWVKRMQWITHHPLQWQTQNWCWRRPNAGTRSEWSVISNSPTPASYGMDCTLSQIIRHKHRFSSAPSNSVNISLLAIERNCLLTECKAIVGVVSVFVSAHMCRTLKHVKCRKALGLGSIAGCILRSCASFHHHFNESLTKSIMPTYFKIPPLFQHQNTSLSAYMTTVLWL